MSGSYSFADAQLEQISASIAHQAHLGQVDQVGEPYILHVEAVALITGIVPGFSSLSQAEQAAIKSVAWLHDVLEDSEHSPSSLLEMGVPEGIVADVDAITHRKHEPRVDYYERVNLNPTARIVKIADISHNRIPGRIVQIPDPGTRARLEKKYEQASEFFGPSNFPAMEEVEELLQKAERLPGTRSVSATSR